MATLATRRIGASSVRTMTATARTIAERRVAQAQIAASHRMRGPSSWLRSWALAQLTAPRRWHPDEAEARELRTHARRLPDLGVAGQQATRTLTQRLGDVRDGAASGEAWRRAVGETLRAAGLRVDVRHAVTVDDLEASHEVWQYTITPVQSNDTIPTPKTLAQSPLAQASGVSVRYHAPSVVDQALDEGEPLADGAQDDRDDDIDARDTVPMPMPIPMEPSAAPAAPATRAATCATGAQGGGGYPHAPGSVRIGDLIEPTALQHVTDVLYGRMQPVTQPLPHRGQQRTPERAQEPIVDDAPASLTSEASEPAH